MTDRNYLGDKTDIGTYFAVIRGMGRDDDTTLKQVVFQRVGRPSRDMREPDWPKMAAEMKRKGVTLMLLWEE